MGRNVFVSMAKLGNVSGRIGYIGSETSQEHLYAVYATEPDPEFWQELAVYNHEEFEKSGTSGKCIEARELVVALPESFIHYDHDRLLKVMTDAFSKKYGVECSAALHHNKSMTNLHLHLVFAERRKLAEPVIKTASRNMFYDEQGKRVRTKKEIVDENGDVRKGCRIVKKGEIYERRIFTIKDTRFKQEAFLDEARKFYTERINFLTVNEKDRLGIFDKGGPYLATKKVGKNNPLEQEIRSDNETRMEWNRAVDSALKNGVPEKVVLQVKQKMITEKVQESIAKNGMKPELFGQIVKEAVRMLGAVVVKIAQMKAEKKEKAAQEQAKCQNTRQPAPVKQPAAQQKPSMKQSSGDTRKDPQQIPPQPELPEIVSRIPEFQRVDSMVQDKSRSIYYTEQKKKRLGMELKKCTGVFKGTRRKELQDEISGADRQIAHLKKERTSIVRENGFDSLEAFHQEYKAAKNAEAAYKKDLAKWEKVYGIKATDETTLAGRLEKYWRMDKEEQIPDREPVRKRSHDRDDR